jgi:glyoxylase-like metal-dependent hydrolase (beta-lactamase superfamily II)
MHRVTRPTLALAALSLSLAALAQYSPSTPPPSPMPPPSAPPAAAAPAQPQFATTRVEGTDNVYIFRLRGAQSMFVVTPEGVIATDPIGYGMPNSGQIYLDEIRKVTDKPVKYVIYSHVHFDHVAGGRALKDAGATFIAHRRAKERLAVLKDPHTVLPDEAVGDEGRTIRLGGTTLELTYHGLNHSDSTLVMRLPKERIIFLVDTIPVGALPVRGFIDVHPLELETHIEKVIAMDWDRMIPGHPGVPGARLGTRKDAQDMLATLRAVSAEVKAMAQAGKCWDTVEKELSLAPYAQLYPNHAQAAPFFARRYCGLWGRGA